MANQDDIALLDSKFPDLQGCDFSGHSAKGMHLENCNLSKADLTKADFSDSVFVNCVFKQTKLQQANFTNATFRNCEMKSTAALAIFNNATFEGGSFDMALGKSSLVNTNFIRVIAKCIISEGNDFRGASVDKSSNFDGTDCSRAVAREPIFSGYDYVDGILRRRNIKTTADAQKLNEKNDKNSADRQLVVSYLKSNNTEGRLLCLGLSQSISAFLSNPPAKPNEAESLACYNDYISVLEQIRDHLEKISEALEFSDGKNIETHLPKAADAAFSLKEIIADWWNLNGKNSVNYGLNLGLIGTGVAFLSLIGVTGDIAAPLCATIMLQKPFKD
jgi:uncharacterized protein YjbI with pentapeptide repeats